MRRTKPIAARFWAKVNKGDGCWEWIASRFACGYGAIGVGRRGEGVAYAHRVSWELHHGPVPAGLWVLHTCDNRKCVNPAHLWLGTYLDNIADMVAKGRQKGHR